MENKDELKVYEDKTQLEGQGWPGRRGKGGQGFEVGEFQIWNNYGEETKRWKIRTNGRIIRTTHS